jgi:hypothetical protein
MSTRSDSQTPVSSLPGRELRSSRVVIPGWVAPATVVALVGTVLTTVVGVVTSLAPLHAPNQHQELGFPLVSAPIGLFMVIVAAVLAARGARRWSGLLAVTGGLWVFNALLVAVRSLGVNGHVPHALFVGSTWVEQWFYVLPDLAAFVVLPMALPAGRVPGKWRILVVAVLAAGAAQVVAGALGSGLMDDTFLTNPLAIGNSSMISLRDNLYVPTLVVGLVIVVVRGVVARRTVAVPMCAALVVGVVAILASTLAEGMLESASRPGWVPWLPVAVAVPVAVVLWARVGLATAATR